MEKLYSHPTESTVQENLVYTFFKVPKPSPRYHALSCVDLFKNIPAVVSHAPHCTKSIKLVNEHENDLLTDYSVGSEFKPFPPIQHVQGCSLTSFSHL